MYNLSEMILRIKAEKKKQRLSNEKLSALSGIPLGTLAKILGSETKDPQISNIIKIAKALGISADYIIFGVSSSKNENELLSLFSSLNAAGQRKVLEYMIDLSENEKYVEKKQ